MHNEDVNPEYCLMSYGTPDSAVMELVTMVVVILKNPKSSLNRKVEPGSSESRKLAIYRWSIILWFTFLFVNMSIANFVTGLQSID